MAKITEKELKEYLKVHGQTSTGQAVAQQFEQQGGFSAESPGREQPTKRKSANSVNTEFQTTAVIMIWIMILAGFFLSPILSTLFVLGWNVVLCVRVQRLSKLLRKKSEQN